MISTLGAPPAVVAGAGAPPTVELVGTPTTFTDSPFGSDTQFAHTVPAGVDYLLLTLASTASQATNSFTCAWNGTPMPVIPVAGTGVIIEMFELVNPEPGTFNITIHDVFASSQDLLATAANYTGVSAATPRVGDAERVQQGSGATISETVTSAGADKTVDALFVDVQAADATPDAGQTQSASANIPAAYRMQTSIKQVAGASTPMGWSGINPTRPSEALAIALKAG